MNIEYARGGHFAVCRTCGKTRANPAPQWVCECGGPVNWNGEIEDMDKTIAVDFDGVIHWYRKGWQDGEIYDEPVPGAIEGLATLQERGYNVIVFTVRENVMAVYSWLQVQYAAMGFGAENAPEVTNQKPGAVAYIDDRAWRFNADRIDGGDWVQVLNEFEGWPVRDPHEQGERGEVLKVAGMGELPTRAYPGDAGFDLYTTTETWVDPGEFVDVPCGVRVELPEQHWGLIVGRSSTLRKRGLLVNLGVIDWGYRGELFAGCWNLTDQPVRVAAGERIAQLIPLPLEAAQMVVQRAALGDSDRGTDGFGSTGK